MRVILQKRTLRYVFGANLVSMLARVPRPIENLERETGFEPATSTLARSHSTTELLPLTYR
jgi:hypothetical protein